MRICVVGLGKLGLPLAALAAASGHEVRGFDVSAAHREALRLGRNPIDEPGLSELLVEAKGSLSIVDGIQEGITDWADLSCIIVPTPSLPNGHFDNTHVVDAVSQVGNSLAPNQRHTVNIVSTVMPGSCDGDIRRVLEASSGRSIGDRLGLCYNPEFIALGSVIADMRAPDMHLIGQSHEQSGDLVGDFLKTLTSEPVPQQRLSLWEAELVKLAINNYVTMKVSFANLLAMLVDAGPRGADADRVTSAVGMDRRIGSRYLKGGAPYGGPCFPRDTRALEALASSLGKGSPLASATEAVNDQVVEHLASLCAESISAVRPASGRPVVCIVGATYKLESGVLDDSPSLALAQSLRSSDIDVVVWDPVRGLLEGHEFRQADLPLDCSLYVLMVQVTEPELLVSGIPRDAHVLDVWRQLSDRLNSRELVCFGRGRSE